MIRRVIKYVNFDDRRGTYRLVLKGKHVGYYMTLEEAARVRNIECVKRHLQVPDDDYGGTVPPTVAPLPSEVKQKITLT